MSVLIKDMKMPKTCIMCWLSPICPVWVKEVSRYKGYDNRLPDCPLIEVSPHGRLIDADALEDKLNEWTRENFSFSSRYEFNLEGMIRASNFAMLLPTIIEAEGREE